MTLDLSAISSAVQSHALASGWFERVNGHEPLSSPGNGLSAAVWVDQVGPDPGRSGLAASSARVTLFVRIYGPMTDVAQDEIDPNIIGAADVLMRAYSGDFALGGLVASVDLLGQSGEPLSGRAGYLRHGDAEYRIFTITLPILVNDLWEQAS